MNPEKSSNAAAWVSVFAAFVSIVAAIFIHFDDLSVSRSAVRVAEEALKSEQSWRKRPLVLFDAGIRDKLTLRNYGNGPALYVEVEFGGPDDRATLGSDHLMPEQECNVEIEFKEPARSYVMGTVQIKCIDVDGVEHTSSQKYWVKSLGEEKFDYQFSDASLRGPKPFIFDK